MIKPIEEKFGKAMLELFKLAGDDEDLRLKMRDWSTKNFRMYQAREMITFEKRLNMPMDRLMALATNKLVSHLMQNLSATNDMQLTTVQEVDQNLELRAEIIVFAAGAKGNETEPPIVA